MPARLVPFLGVVALLTLTPGPDMALVLRNGIRAGASAAWWTGLGCCTGIAVWALAAMAGLTAALAASAAVFTALKLAGAAYLVYLGVAALWGSRHELAPRPPSTEPVPADRRLAFRQGLVSNLLNPKIGLLFLTLIPQFVSPEEPQLRTSLTLSLVFLGIALLWWRAFSLAVHVLGRMLSRRRVRAALERLSGAVLVGLGIRVALGDR